VKTYPNLDKLPQVVNDNTLTIPVYDISLDETNVDGTIKNMPILDSNDLAALGRKLQALQNGRVCWLVMLNRANQVIGYIAFQERDFPYQNETEKTDLIKKITQTLCKGICIISSNPKEIEYSFNEGIKSKFDLLSEGLRKIDIEVLDYAIKDDDYFFHSIHNEREKGGNVITKYTRLDNMMPDVVSEKGSPLHKSSAIKISKKEYFKTDSRYSKLEGSFSAQELFFDFWDKSKLNMIEQMNVLFLNNNLKPIGLYQHTTGGVTGTVLDFTLVVAVAVKIGAKKVIIAHNHPSGQTTASNADIRISRQLREALDLVNIELVDSLIITKEHPNHASIFEQGLLEDGGEVAKERNMQTARIILEQLGGVMTLFRFTGAYNFVAIPSGVSFRIKNRKVNYVEITLNSMDTYDVVFGRIHGGKYKVVKELNGIYNDQLKEVFTRYTGMVLSFRKGGAVQANENAEAVLNKNLQIKHHTEEFQKIVKNDSHVPAWVVSKMTRAADSISDATHYLEGNMKTRKMYADGGMVKDMLNMSLAEILKNSPIKVENSPYHLDIQLKYNKGGMNYFTSRSEERGFYLHVSPVKIDYSQSNPNVYTKTYAAFSGIKKLILVTKKYHDKFYREAENLAEQSIDMLVENVMNKIKQDYPDATLQPKIIAPIIEPNSPEEEFEEMENINAEQGNINDILAEIESLESILDIMNEEDLEYYELQIEILKDNIAEIQIDKIEAEVEMDAEINMVGKNAPNEDEKERF
jgi:hypothetical protein